MKKSEIAEFYEACTGFKAKDTRGCLDDMKRIIEAWNLPLTEVTIENHGSNWNKYSNRTWLEKQAVAAGGNFNKGIRWWLVPKSQPKTIESKTCKQCKKKRARWFCTRWLYRYHWSFPEWCPYFLEKQLELQDVEQRYVNGIQNAKQKNL